MRKKKGVRRFLCALLCAATLTAGVGAGQVLQVQATKKDDLKRQNEEDETRGILSEAGGTIRQG